MWSNRTLDSEDLFDIVCSACGRRSVIYLFECYHTYRCPACCFCFWAEDGELCKAARSLALLSGAPATNLDVLRDGLKDAIRTFCLSPLLSIRFAAAVAPGRTVPVNIAVSNATLEETVESFRRAFERKP
jgi:hypothetical protein